MTKSKKMKEDLHSVADDIIQVRPIFEFLKTTFRLVASAFSTTKICFSYILMTKI